MFSRATQRCLNAYRCFWHRTAPWSFVLVAFACVHLLFVASAQSAPIDEPTLPKIESEPTHPPLPSGSEPPTESPAGTGNAWADLPRLQSPQVQEARRALADGRLEECLALLNTAAADDASLAPPQLLLAYLFLAESRWQDAQIALERAAAQYKVHPEVYQLFGFLALDRQQNTDAWVHLERALALAPPEAWPNSQVTGFRVSCYAGLAEVAQRRRDFVGADEVFAAWAKLAPDDSDVQERWGAALFETGQADAAFAKLKTAHELDAAKNLPELSLASLHLKRGEFDAATALYERSLKKYPQDGRVFFEYGGALLFMGQAQRAKQFIDQASKSPDFAAEHELDIALFSGLIARAEGKHGEAEDHFLRVLKLSPGHVQALQQLPLALIEQPDEAKRKRAFEIAALQARRQPNSPPAVSTLGAVQYRLGHLEDAEHNLRRAVLLSPDGESLYYLARVLVDRNQSSDAKQAIASLQAAIDGPGFFLLRDEAEDWLSTASLVVE